MSDDLAPTGEDTATTEQPQGGDTQPSFDDRLNERLSEITGGIPDLVSQAVAQSMSQWQQSQQPAEEADDDWDLEPGDDGYEQQQLEQYIAQQVEEGIKAQLTPMQQERELERRNDAFGKLTEQYPELLDQQKAAPYVEEALEIVGGDEAFVNSPRFVDLLARVYKAAKADERAKQETPADGRTTPLESQGGAAPQEADEESLDDRLSRMVQQSNNF